MVGKELKRRLDKEKEDANHKKKNKAEEGADSID